LGPKAFEQCAGFMRIQGGDNPLDATGVHPESYEATQKLLEILGLSLEDIKEIQAKSTKQKDADPVKKTEKVVEKKKDVTVKSQDTAIAKAMAAAMGGGLLSPEVDQRNNKTSLSNQIDTVTVIERKIKDKSKMASELGIGEITLTDIVKELEKPGRDPRDEMPKPILRTDVLEMKDLTEGMILKGTVRNVIDFGAFVDIGVHQDGLVHISQLSSKKFVKHPLDVVSVGDIVEVKVLSIDAAKKRIALTMIL